MFRKIKKFVLRKRSDSNGYRKDSMDRLGDDLTEVILQYLTFADKIRLECVSKQWKRCMSETYKKQSVIEIHFSGRERHNSLNKLMSWVKVDDNYNDSKELNEQNLESVLKKCPNIEKLVLRIRVNSSVLSLIGRYCHRIKSLSLYKPSVDEKSLSFFRQYGHKLEDFELYGSDELVEHLPKFCPNLKNILFNNERIYYNFFTEDEEFLPKLEEIELTITYKDINLIKILSHKYSQTMKTLDVTLSHLDSKELKTCIECIARFENLKELKLTIYSSRSTQPIDYCLSLIGQKCNKLLKLELYIDSGLPISDRFFDIFYKFEAIKKLKIELSHNTVLSGSVECFKHCKQLKHLEINYFKLREDLFANIASFVPKLQLLKIGNDIQFSDSFVDSFHSIKNMQKVELSWRYAIDKYVNYKTWYFGKSLSEVMLSPNGMNVKHITHNCGLITVQIKFSL